MENIVVLLVLLFNTGLLEILPPPLNRLNHLKLKRMQKGISIWTINYWNYKYILLKEFVFIFVLTTCWPQRICYKMTCPSLPDIIIPPSFTLLPVAFSLLASNYYPRFLYQSLLHIIAHLLYPYHLHIITLLLYPSHLVIIARLNSVSPLTFTLLPFSSPFFMFLPAS